MLRLLLRPPIAALMMLAMRMPDFDHWDFCIGAFGAGFGFRCNSGCGDGFCNEAFGRSISRCFRRGFCCGFSNRFGIRLDRRGFGRLRNGCLCCFGRIHNRRAVFSLSSCFGGHRLGLIGGSRLVLSASVLASAIALQHVQLVPC